MKSGPKSFSRREISIDRDRNYALRRGFAELTMEYSTVPYLYRARYLNLRGAVAIAIVVETVETAAHTF